MLTLSGQEGIDNFNRLLNYRLPAWEDLPSDIQSRQFQRFVQHELGWLFPDEPLLTGYMLQNYLKWDILPPVEGRKYNREHVAWCLVISLLKQVLSLDQVKLGILMQYRLMPIKDSYEVFREEFSAALRYVFIPLVERRFPEPVGFPGEKLAPNRLATGAACRSLAWNILTNTLMENGGAEVVFEELKNFSLTPEGDVAHSPYPDIEI